MSARYAIVCDGCLATAKEASRLSLAGTRRMNRPAGWRQLGHRGKDYCPVCVPPAQAPKPACSLCNTHPAIGTQHPRPNVEPVLVCALCAAPGQAIGRLPGEYA